MSQSPQIGSRFLTEKTNYVLIAVIAVLLYVAIPSNRVKVSNDKKMSKVGKGDLIGMSQSPQIGSRFLTEK